METTTPFDLNHAILQWRKTLAQSSAFRAENLDELEAHLRDSVATWQAHGLADDEAFLIGTKRVGNGTVLGKEFGKVNGVNVWAERCLWALIAIQIWGMIRSVVAATSIFLSLTGNIASNTSGGWMAAVSLLLFSFVPMVVAGLLVWWLLSSPKSKAGGLLENLSARPMAAAAFFFILGVGESLLTAYSLNYYNHGHGGISHVSYIFLLPPNFAYALLIFLLARKRLLRKA